MNMLYLYGEEAKRFQTKNTAIALGKFDGVHLGHQMLIKGILEEQKQGKQSLVFTFGSTPNVILKNEQKHCYIYTKEEKIKYFSDLGVDVVLEYPFTREFATMSPRDFITEILVKKLNVKSIYVGEDFCFGKDRKGDVSLLKSFGDKYDFHVHAYIKKRMENQIISSTSIREALQMDFPLANKMLGTPYFIYGRVLHGNQLGRTIQFPTINQKISSSKIVPQYGVYESRVKIHGIERKAISNLGMKPTVESNRVIGLETHILNFDEDLYDECVKTELIKFIRPEIKFDSLDLLKSQIQRDMESIQ